MKFPAFAKCFAAFVVVLALLSFSFAQVQNGEFTGSVIDPQGAAVPNATVTVKNLDTGLTRTAVTGPNGAYRVTELPVGRYSITANATGFKASTANNAQLSVGAIQRQDLKLQIGQASETVDVTTEPSQVQTDDAKLSQTVTTRQIENLPLNGRNVYDLIQLAPGAVNVRGVLSENGANTVVNGIREDFNGFLLNGVSNKGLSGGPVNQPIQDSVQEFQLLTLNESAQYGNSGGSITNLVTKSGTNAFHGSAFEFLRNDALDANDYFLNNQGVKRPPLRFNQFGATLGGPIVKDKLFFFGAYQGDRFLTNAAPSPVTVESPEFRQAVIAANPNSVAALLYSSFPPAVTGTPNGDTIGDHIDPTFHLCDSSVGPARAAQFAKIFGVTAADQAAMQTAGCGVLPIQSGLIDRNTPFSNTAVVLSQSRTQNNLFNGNEASARIDYNFNQNNQFFAQFNFTKTTDEFFAGISSLRGFTNPETNRTPNGQISFVHTFSPTVVNEFRAGYAGNLQTIKVGDPGVPQISFGDGTYGFGSYNGYPQTFHENIYSYSDLVSVNKGKHGMKIGVDVRRNIENSDFNVARPSYYFFDPLFFAIDQPAEENAGVDPGFVDNTPAHLQSNQRHWRNVEIGGYFQDDWKATSRLTLNLGLRYDLFTRHTELNNQVTTFILGPGANLSEQVLNASVHAGDPGCDTPDQVARAVLAGVCGPGGFAVSKSLGKGDHNNFGPRVGFAYDVFGNGKTSIRGGFGLSYEGTLYNPLSNSRWNPPFYSFNSADNDLFGGPSTIVYGPVGGGQPTFTGASPASQFAGVGAQATGNINGWFPGNPQTANLTGIVFPNGIRDPYVLNFHLSAQHQLLAKLVGEIDYVGTQGRKLFRAVNINTFPGDRLPAGTTVVNNLGDTLVGLGHSRFHNLNFGNLRNWENSVSSNYNAMQFALKQQAWHGVAFNFNYTWSHALDGGSTWHSGATSANGAAGGEGYLSNVLHPDLDYGNSIFDIRHRVVANYVWDVPGYAGANGFLKALFAGYRLNGIVSYQSGAHWSPFCSSLGKCDYNKDGIANDRPDSRVSNFTPTKDMLTNGWFNADPTLAANGTNALFAAPCLGCQGNLRRNQFVGPSFVSWDPSLIKTFKATERVDVQFRAEAFNVLNHTNFQLPGANGAGHNRINDAAFGEAGGAFNPRQLQFGLRIAF